MGNCQVVDAAAALIQHPDGKVERFYSSVGAREVMGSHPGHYVAVYVAPRSSSSLPPSTSSSRGGGGATQVPVKRHLKLMRPDDTLHVGNTYRLVTFEEVLKEFATRKSVKLSRLLSEGKRMERDNTSRDRTKKRHQESGESSSVAQPSRVPVTRESAIEPREEEVVEESGYEEEEEQCIGMGGLGMGRRFGGQWRPALQSIAETS